MLETRTEQADWEFKLAGRRGDGRRVGGLKRGCATVTRAFGRRWRALSRGTATTASAARSPSSFTRRTIWGRFGRCCCACWKLIKTLRVRSC